MNIEAMTGAEVDRIIHQTVFGGEDLSDFRCQGYNYSHPKTHIYVREHATGVTWRDVPMYTEDVTLAWKLVDKMRAWGGCTIDCYSSRNGSEWYEVTTIKDDKTYKWTSYTAPIAICKCFLSANNA